ncbi:SurA N-terminal domain-containing protein [uncultured Gimesia sp.]|uniref:SurA N-terminal domain-containing protein n=1 Tax=uncultured Gimesia sp. TaxID=1678688 RepID=UPI002608008E|nr:SurA N-terminal domain-containing protein [uncultured Gimesia sp.]
MASPLELFRKKQKVLMVPLTILAMFAFIVMDQLKPEQFPPILGMLIFGGLFWYLGKDRGKGTLFAVFGVIIGFFLGYINMPRQGAAMVVTSTAGDIDQMEFQKLVRNRQIANQFVSRTYYESLPEEERERAQPPRGAMFGFGRDTEDDIILEFLFRKEAEKMNLIVADDAITQYISRYTNNRLSRTAFQKACQNMGLTEGQIYDIIRDQLQARLAFQMLRPEVSLTPDQYWNFYKKFNVREELELVALPVKNFEDQVQAPTDAEKKVFFENYKSVFPNEKGPGTPGLRQPQKVQVEYLMADYEETEKQVAPVTDQQIKTFYEENMERLYKNNPIPDSPDMPAPTAPQSPAGPKANQPVEAVKPGTAVKPETAKPETAKPETTEKKPAAPVTPKPEPAPETKPKETPKAKETPKESTEKKKEESSARELDPAFSTFVSLLDEKPADKKPAETPVVAPKPGTAPVETKAEAPTTAPAPLEPYRPLNDDLKSEIRDQLLRERTLTLMKEKISAALIFMNDLSYRINSPDEGVTPPTPQEITERLKSYAAKHQLVYNITPMMSAQEMEESQKYPLGTAKEPTLNQFTAQPRTVIEQLFETPTTVLYTAYEAEDSFSSALLAYWKARHIDAMIPKYEDPEIDELITEQLKLEGARPIALKRAEALKKLIIDAGDKDMPEALKGQTITGKKEGEELSTQTTESFSWMRTSTAGASNPFSMPRPELSSISAVAGAGNEFMEQVFDNLDNGGVGTVMNADKSVCYVVKVINRIPSTPGGLTAMYQEFLKTDLFFFFSPYLPLAQMEQQQTNYEWSRELEAKYQVQKFFEQAEETEEKVE